MKRTQVIEFNYDGCNMWAYNGGRIMGSSEIISIIGREAFFEGCKLGDSFRVTIESDLTIVAIP